MDQVADEIDTLSSTGRMARYYTRPAADFAIDHLSMLMEQGQFAFDKASFFWVHFATADRESDDDSLLLPNHRTDDIRMSEDLFQRGNRHAAKPIRIDLPYCYE